MRRLLVALALASCSGVGVREVRTEAGAKIYEAKCQYTPEGCLEDSRRTCPDGYAVLESDSHAGGTAADAIPADVMWFAMTFRCDGSGHHERPAFAFRGPRPAPVQATTFSTPPPPSAGGKCASDVDCPPGLYCAKGAYKTYGVCAEK